MREREKKKQKKRVLGCRGKREAARQTAAEASRRIQAGLEHCLCIHSGTTLLELHPEECLSERERSNRHRRQ